MQTFKCWSENQNQERILVIMRSPPGGGKSFTAKEMLKKYGGGDPAGHIFSTDDYFIQDVLNDRRNREAAGQPIDYQYENELASETYRKN